MYTLIKPLFRLMVVTFIFALLMPVTTTRANPDCSDPKHAGNPNCPPPDDPSITYTVELMGRVFHFADDPDADPVDVTPNEKENALFPDHGDLTFSRPSDEDASAAWDAVFASCENFFGPHPIPPIGPTPIVVSEFTVLAGDWRINKAGGVRLVMPDIPFNFRGNYDPYEPDFKVTLQLIGDEFFDDPDASWLPDPDNVEEYAMISSWITGGTVKGVRPRKSCVSKGGTEIITDFDPGQVRTLKIEAN